MARLYADENFPRQVVEALRQRGHDVWTTHEAGQSEQAVTASTRSDCPRSPASRHGPFRYNLGTRRALMLSENAVAVLRFRVKGWRFPVRDRDLAAFEELVSAGIMESDGNGD